MKKIFAIAITMITAASLQAQSFDRSVRPKPGPAPVINIADAQAFTLPNGLKVFVVENHKLPSVSFQIDLDINPALQGNAVGYQDMIGELLSSGTQLKSKNEFNKQLDALGGTLNAGKTGVYASCLTKHQDAMLALMSEMILKPKFTQVELDKLKTQTLSGLASNKDDPQAMSSNLGAKLLFGNAHTYGEITTEATVKAITLDMCKKFYATYFRPNTAYMAVVGDITMEQAKVLATKYFGAWQKGIVPVAKYTTPKNNLQPRVAFVNKSGAVQSVVNVTHTVNLKPGTMDNMKARVANNILGGGSAGRLFQNLREGHGWTYGSYSSLDADKLENAGQFSATAECTTEATDSSVGAILMEMKRMSTELVPTKVVEDIKNNMAGKFAISLEDPKTLARNAINIEKYKMDKDYYRNYLKNLANINANDVMEISKKYINPNIVNITVAGDKSEVANKLAKFAGSGKTEIYNMYGQLEKDVAKVALPANLKGIDVVMNYINAVGGVENWTNIKDIVTTMTLEAGPGQVLDMVEKKKAPNKFYSELTAGGQVFQKKVFNGVKGSEVNMGQEPKEMDADGLIEMKEEASFLGEVAFLDKAYKVELKGVEKIDGKDAYVVKVSNEKGKVRMYYYDVASKLKVKSSEEVEIAPGKKATVSMFYSNYQIVQGGMKLPYTMKQLAGPNVFNISIKGIEINKGIDDKVFE
jgi:zinc protease